MLSGGSNYSFNVRSLRHITCNKKPLIRYRSSHQQRIGSIGWTPEKQIYYSINVSEPRWICETPLGTLGNIFREALTRVKSQDDFKTNSVPWGKFAFNWSDLYITLKILLRLDTIFNHFDKFWFTISKRQLSVVALKVISTTSFLNIGLLMLVCSIRGTSRGKTYRPQPTVWNTEDKPNPRLLTRGGKSERSSMKVVWRILEICVSHSMRRYVHSRSLESFRI